MDTEKECQDSTTLTGVSELSEGVLQNVTGGSDEIVPADQEGGHSPVGHSPVRPSTTEHEPSTSLLRGFTTKALPGLVIATIIVGAGITIPKVWKHHN
jgi:hypothetical protein